MYQDSIYRSEREKDEWINRKAQESLCTDDGDGILYSLLSPERKAWLQYYSKVKELTEGQLSN